MKPIRLHWYRARTTTGVNFGDDLSPLLVARLSGRPVEWAPPHLADLLAIGSLLQHLGRSLRKPRDRADRLLRLRFGGVAVWGSGTFGPKNLPRRRQIRVGAVRGPLTREALGLDAGVPVGDPGLLVGMLRRPGPKAHRWGIIPHVSDAERPAIRALAETLPRATVLDLSAPCIEETLGRISGCEFVISSSLHGLVVADAYGIPSVWMSLSGDLWGGDWKFRDYFGSVARDNTVPIHLSGPSDIPTASKLEARATLAEQATIERVKTGLIAAFGALDL